jgi:hypothetical protein
MPTLAVGMLETRENYDMPTASVGMAPFSNTFHDGNLHRHFFSTSQMLRNRTGLP